MSKLEVEDIQSFKVQVEMVAMMLSVIQKMSCITTFGQSKTYFDGTTVDPSMGIGQGATAAPPTFTAQSTLMMNSSRPWGRDDQRVDMRPEKKR